MKTTTAGIIAATFIALFSYGAYLNARTPVVEKKSVEQQLAITHQARLNDYLKSPPGFKVTKSWTYPEGTSYVSCMEHTADGRTGKTVLVKRRSQSYFKTSDNAWKKYCSERQIKRTESFLEEDVK